MEQLSTPYTIIKCLFCLVYREKDYTRGDLLDRLDYLVRREQLDPTRRLVLRE